MRRSLSLALLLVGLSALPAAAGDRDGGHVFFGFHRHFAHHFSHFFHFRHFAQFGTSRFFVRSSPFFFGNSRFLAPFVWDWGEWADGDGAPVAGAAPGTVILLAAPQPRAQPSAPPAEAHATVETTAAGVTVVRGPGTHHFLP